MFRNVSLTLFLSLVALRPAYAAEVDTLLASYGPLEWVAGTDTTELNNGSGWSQGFERANAQSVNLSEPHSATSDLDGNIYISDKNAHAIRVIEPSGIIRTVAGTNVEGIDAQENGLATSRRLSGPQNAYPLPDGSLYILDTGNQRIRKVSPNGFMNTVIRETSGLSRGLWVSRNGSIIYYCTNSSLRRWTPANGTNPGARIADGFLECGNIDVARNGDIYVTDRIGHRVTRVYLAPNAPPNSTNYLTEVVAGLGDGTDTDFHNEGALARSTGLQGVRGVAFHPLGGYFLATHKGGDIWYVDTAGIISLIVRGDSSNEFRSQPIFMPSRGSAVQSELRSISVGLNGDLLIATNDSGFIKRAKFIPPSVASPPAPSIALTTTLDLQWPTLADRWYRLEATTDLTVGPWTPLLTQAGTGSPTRWTDPAWSSHPDRRFFRVREFRDWPN